MKHKGLIAVVLSVAALAGCNAQKQHAMALEDAQVSLAEQFPERAQLQLDKADRIARENRLKTGIESQVLRAEALLQMGQVEQAQQIAQQIAADYVPGTIQRAQAEELLAKVAIRQGRFLDAQMNLSEADRSYTSPVDKARINDLLNLVRGLEAWSGGRTVAAKTHWDSIVDKDLRSSVLAHAEQ
ncbi:MAG: hypothetical protein ACLFUJ_10650 [Phycisphaerae bacterium]